MHRRRGTRRPSRRPRAFDPCPRLRYRISGGIEGYEDRLDISEDRIARLYFADKLASAAHLTANDAEVLDSLRARSGRINLAYSSPVDVSDAIGLSILFDGKGSAPL